MPLRLAIDAVCPTTGARATTIHTPRGTVETPCFMPVGTYGAIKAIDTPDIAAMGYPVVLANALHVYLRPGLEVFRAVGGLHRFMGWDRHLLTDSGGFQLFSLNELAKIEESGVQFRSPVDGIQHFLSPGLVMDIQRTLGSDFIMPLDHCPTSTAPRPEVAAAVDRTTRWLAEQCELFASGEVGDPVSGSAPFVAGPQGAQNLFGIVQGGVYEDLRMESLRQITALPIDALAVGGLAVGESQAV
ncbi:MAG TPA: tRNA guanosine(34) transglycosylase Tgt, partial [bacterium]|nr:tRNA guanosine(34) transglycosylase Tgt [bacterium]